MVQVGTRSFSDGSLASEAQTRTFDIAKEQDALQLLKALHRSALSPEEKNQLRNAFFAYTQKSDTDQLQQLQSLFSEYGFAIQTAEANAVQQQEVQTTTPKSTKSFGRARRAPVFSQAKQTPVASQVETLQQQEVVQTPKEPEKVVESVEQQPTGVTYGDPLERIKEIKHAVNAKVGNPVSLIGVDAKIGREYMNALLNAMKLVNGGNAQELNKAMEALEAVYKQVDTLDLTKKEEVQPEEKPQEEVKIPVVSNVPEPPKPEPVQEVQEEQPVAPQQKEVVAPFASVAEKLQKEEAPPKKTVVETPEAKVMTKEEVLQDTKPQPVPEPEKAEGKFTSVGKEKQIQDLMQNNRVRQVQEQKKQEEIERANTDPLQLPEVTAGLHQLLSEWSLFKSSGFFGVGPSGVDHPLYKKLQALTMAAVIAGRFEGATPTIKQSITDYMNGWRYEEGIIHEHAETFEHYLRRVIKHILEKQNKLKAAA